MPAGASKTSETLCENSMAILRLLSEEVFDFSKDSLTQARLLQGYRCCFALCPAAALCCGVVVATATALRAVSLGRVCS